MRLLPRQIQALEWMGVVLVAVGGLNGCASSSTAPMAYSGPTLASADLGGNGPACPPRGFVVLESAPSQGRFPGALAVARLEPSEALTPGGSETGLRWRVASPKVEESAYWLTAFTTRPQIREVIIFDELSVPSPEADLKTISESAQHRTARLCLVYGPAPAEASHAALTGVLMDTERGTPIARISADAGPEDFEPPHADRRPSDLRHCDVNYLAARQFERHTRECIDALVAHDKKSATTQPSPWQNAAPPAAYPIYVIPPRSMGKHGDW